MKRLFLVSMLACIGCSRQPVNSSIWQVMGTVAQVRWQDDCGRPFGQVAPELASNVFLRIETLLNAHDPASELSRLAALPDDQVLEKCSPEVRPCYEMAFRLRDQTRGLFNPRWRGPKSLDLGAIAKGFAVDLVADSFRSVKGGPCRLLVDLGGNMKAVGSRGWSVGIRDGCAFELESGAACATSACYFRGNHIRDGRTGGEVSNSVHSVTVIHPTSAMLADGLSTVMFLLGKEEGEAFVKRFYPEVRLCWIFRE